MDCALKGRISPAYTTKQLKAFVDNGRGNPKMVAEISRREAIIADDKSKMTPVERLLALQDKS